MAKLVLMRHAKSSWAQPALSDHNRPLNPRGREAANKMAAALMARDLQPQAIICSTAMRTRKTLVPLLNLMKGTVSLTFSSELYSASADDYMQMIARHSKDLQPDDILMFIGHNFAIQDATLQMAVKSQTPSYQNLKEKFPSGAIAVLELANGFSSCGPHSAILKDFLRPRDDL